MARPGVKLELQLQASATAMAMPDPWPTEQGQGSNQHPCGHCQILNPLSHARNSMIFFDSSFKLVQMGGNLYLSLMPCLTEALNYFITLLVVYSVFLMSYLKQRFPDLP